MTTAGPLGPLLEHWQLALAAGAGGVLLALAFLLAEYAVVPALRFRAAKRRGPASVAALIGSGRLRLRRLYDRAAVMEEHGHPDAKAVRQDADLGRLVLGAMERKTGAP